ncbi:hypothetical protein, partial [Klebsiella michiganensis]|uniref:hypothetical protein n=1 Tax=Klebsiella michiganensis TaxID=1134687 RepID=UPI001CA4D44D
ETVNELIQSLESAGELSIKETKVMALAKAYQQLAAENVALKNVFGPGDSVLNFLTIALRHTTYDQIDLDDVSLAFKMSLPETPATDRIVAGIKADAAAEREKTITFTAAKKRTQDGVALIAIGKPYKIHNDDVIGEFFIGERGRYGVITMDRINYFTTSDEYAWEFSLREGADK